MHEKIREGFDVFLHDGEKSFGAVRQVRKTELVVYIENGGDFDIPSARSRMRRRGRWSWIPTSSVQN